MITTLEPIYRLVETDNYTYDLTFEDRDDKIVVYIYNHIDGETEVYDVIRKTINPKLDYETNFDENVERYIKETF